MARAKAGLETGSLLRAIDGTHLRWHDFREDVLQPFGIKVANARELDSIPPALLIRLQERLHDLGRFDLQREQWRSQVNAGQGFAHPTVFPPSILPSTWYPARTQRYLLPKMSRETLPRRSKTATSLFELPSARPISVTAFVTEALTEMEHASLPSSLSPGATVVDFVSGLVDFGRTLHCPFITFERCQGFEADDLESALNMCAISGAQCVRGLQEICHRARKDIENLFTFSCAINDKIAILNIHTIDESGSCLMSALYKFDLLNDDHFNTFQAWIEAIEDWGSTSLLPDLKDLLTKASLAGDTPPASPMPSLALSVDTEVGIIPGLMQTLRKTYPAVAWKTNEVAESPINSSIAHCGTPAERRRSQGMFLGSPSDGAFGELMLRRGNVNSALAPLSIPRGLQTSYAPVRPSPFSPRYSASTPILESVTESPCRPGTVSPYTPPTDQPWAAKSPVLVLQKRFDVAMSEISDLRQQVEMLQMELSLNNQRLMERLAAIELPHNQQEEIQITMDVQETSVQVEIQEAIQEQEEEEDKQARGQPSLVRETWDVLLTQLLFVPALVLLTFFGYVFCFGVLPRTYQTFSSFDARRLLLDTDTAWLNAQHWSGRVQDMLHASNLIQRFGFS